MLPAFWKICKKKSEDYAHNWVEVLSLRKLINITKMLQLITERLILRAWQESDAAEMAKWNANGSNFKVGMVKPVDQNGDYKFVGVDGNEFPQMEESGEEKFEMLIPAKEIPKSIDKTVFAAGTDTMRPIMMGILWDIKPDSIVFVASDTHKLVRYINSSVAPGIEGSFILPTKPASILSSILAKEDGDVKVAFDSKSVSFETETYTLICRFINGKYPNYNAVIPQNNPYVITVDRQLLLNAIKRVGIFATDGGLVQLQFTDNNIFIKAQDVEYSTSAEECLSCEYSGENLSMGFNKDKIIEVLNNVVVDNVLIKISDPARPGLFLPVEQKENEDLLVLLMPMMIPSL